MGAFMKKIMFYGDSNTYGYDPADWRNGRYREDLCWTSILQKKLGEEYKIIPQGLNGRRLPDMRLPQDLLLSLFKYLGEDGIFAVMLGTNDLLCGSRLDGVKAAERLPPFIEFLLGNLPAERILIIAPPCVGRKDSKDPSERQFYEESLRMNREMETAAKEKGVRFLDAGGWNIGLAFDQVHFSEEGHREFAQRMEQALCKILYPEE